MRNGDRLPIEFMARRDDWSDGVSLYMRQITVGHETVVAEPLTLVPLAPCAIAEPMMQLSLDSAHQLMDELWRCGLRPTEGSGSAGSLAATERHLKDMRDIALGLLRKDGVQP